MIEIRLMSTDGDSDPQHVGTLTLDGDQWTWEDSDGSDMRWWIEGVMERADEPTEEARTYAMHAEFHGTYLWAEEARGA